MTTYSLLVRSEDRNRSILEVAIYLLVALSTIVSIWQFAQQTDRLQTDTTPKPAIIAVASAGDGQS